MDIPDPSEVPSKRIRNYLKSLKEAIMGVRPIAGTGIRTDEHPGQGTVISVDTSSFSPIPGVTPGPGGTFSTITLDVCVDGETESHTFVITE